jgi:shikimate kinase
MQLFHMTTHEDRINIDQEIERRTGVSCDDALNRRLINEKEFRKIVEQILKRKKKKKKEVVPSVI